MKKPTLRFRQVFEHPTHFKVTKPLGNPLVIAKKGLSPSLMGRLRKYAEGTPDEPVQPPTEQERQTALALQDEGVGVERITAKPWSITPPVEYITETEPTSYATVDNVAPVAEPAPVPAASKPSPDLEIPEPAPVVQTVAAPVVAPAAVPAPAAPVVVIQSPPAATAPATTVQAAPVVEKPSVTAAATGTTTVAPTVAEATQPTVSIEDLARKRQQEFMDAKENALKQQEIASNNLLLAEQDLQARREEESRREYMRRMGALAGATRAEQEAQAEKPMGASDVLRAIGSAVSVAMGAFATGMTGMPNFALQIYNASVDEALKRARENRQSAYNKAIAAGVDARDAEKYWRAQQDKTMALTLQEKANAVQNADAKAKMYDAAQQFYAKSVMDEADVRKKLAEASKAEAEAKSEPLKTQNAALEVQRKAYSDYADALNKAEQIKVTDEASRRAYSAAIYNANKDYEAAMAGIKAKEKSEALPAGVEGMSEYDKLNAAFKAEGTKGLAKQVAQTFSVDGVKLLARSEADRNVQQKFWSGFSSSQKAIDKLTKEIDKMKLWDSLAPTERAARVESLAAKFAVGYPKSEGFQRALSVADKDVVMDQVLQNPTSLKSWLLGLSSASIKALKKSMEEEKIEALKDSVVEGDPNLAKVLEAEKRKTDRGVTFAR